MTTPIVKQPLTAPAPEQSVKVDTKEKVNLLPAEKVPSDWVIKAENNKYSFVHRITNKTLNLDSIEDFNKLLRS